ncbi:MAG: hypothetical protein ACFCU7_18195 [Pleurocapsa sp.]
MLNPVVSQAREWGFICQRQESNYWLILPQQSPPKWQLAQVEDRWILIVGDFPQLRLYAEEAIAFLAARRFDHN